MEQLLLKQLGARISALRVERCLTLADLAAGCELSTEALAQVEAGQGELNHLPLIAEKLGTTPKALLEDLPFVDDLKQKLGAKIQGLRNEHNWTPEQFAGICNFPVAQISRIECGQSTFGLEELSECAKKLGTTASALLDGIA